jgi:glycosyltransferase involved in cell wall biosynthesis
MKLSIITINKNNSAGLEKTIKSVICQNYTDFEYIVIDGASDDDSVEVIKRFADKIDYWVSEPDTGIYNAMNKGIRKAQGDYCLFLNSGDWLISSETLCNVFAELNDLIPSDIYYGDRINSDGTLYKYPKVLSINDLLLISISHQNSLIRRSLFLEHGFYNENLHICSDTEFFIFEMWKYKSKFTYIKTNISIFDPYGIGSIDSPEHRAENLTMYQNVFGELSESIIKYINYCNNPYWKIVETYGNTRLLNILLKSYRFLIIKINKLKRLFTK